jgi:hypothetical protein
MIDDELISPITWNIHRKGQRSVRLGDLRKWKAAVTAAERE